MLDNMNFKRVKISSISKCVWKLYGISWDSPKTQSCRTRNHRHWPRGLRQGRWVTIVLAGWRFVWGISWNTEGYLRSTHICWSPLFARHRTRCWEYKLGPCFQGAYSPAGLTWEKKVVCVFGEILQRGCDFSCPGLVTDLEEMEGLFIGTLEKSQNTRHWMLVWSSDRARWSVPRVLRATCTDSVTRAVGEKWGSLYLFLPFLPSVLPSRSWFRKDSPCCM